jgi:NAD+ diphosphatase
LYGTKRLWLIPGLHIKNLKYFGSQPWPYPSGIMIGFTADYESGNIKLQQEELSAGAFYTKDNLPEIPKKLSLARKLIDAWLEEKKKSSPFLYSSKRNNCK